MEGKDLNDHLQEEQRKPPVREPDGKIIRTIDEIVDFDYKTATLMKLLKKKDIEDVIEQEADLVDIIAKLRPIGVVKG